jgi:hypothetical protein
MPGDDAIAGDDLVRHAEVAAAVSDEGVDLFERPGIEEDLHALARGQLPGITLALQALFPTAQRGPSLKVV